MPLDYADISTRYSGSYLYAVRVTIGAAERRWSTSDLSIDGLGHIEGRVIRGGTVDRTLESLRQAPDVTLELADTDGAIASLFDFDDAASNILRAEISIHRGAADLAWGEWQKVATFHYAELIEVRDDGACSIRLTQREDWPVGRLTPMLEEDMLDQLKAEWPSTFGTAQMLIPARDDPRSVPLVVGSFWPISEASPSQGYAYDGIMTRVTGRHAGNWGTLTNTQGAFCILGVSAHGWHLNDDVRIFYRLESGALGRGRWPKEALQQFVVTGVGYVLCLKFVESYPGNSTARRLLGDLEAAGVAPFGSDARLEPFMVSVAALDSSGNATQFGLKEAAESLIQLAEPGAWATYGDADSWEKADREYPSVKVRAVIDESVSATTALGDMASSVDAWVYVSRNDKIAIARIPNEAIDEDATPVLILDAEHDIISSRARLVDRGIGALSNVYKLDISGALPPMGVNIDPIIEDRHQASIDRHLREVVREIDGQWLANRESAGAVISRLSSLYGNHRWALDIELPSIGTILELGDVVQVAPEYLPTWTVARRCLVIRMTEDLDLGSARITVVDFDDAIGAKLYRVNNTAAYRAVVGSTNTYAFVDAGSDIAIIISSVASDLSSITAGNVLCVRTTTNRFNARIAVVAPIDSTSIVLQITTAGGGSLPDADESDIESFEILVSHANRNTALDNYTPPQDIFGFLDADYLYGVG